MEFQRFWIKACFRKAGEANGHINLPEELLIEIFLRLSVKSLVCSKCVCNHWYDIIRNPNFILDHLQYQKRHNQGHLLLQYFKNDTQHYHYALFEDEFLENDTYSDLVNFQLPQYGLKMEGPVNGLYCLFDRKDRIVLWNPALKEFRTLPLPHPHFMPHLIVHISKIGFGVDPLTQDYKVVLIRIFIDMIKFERHPSIYISVYNLSTDTWRLLDLGDFRICSHHFCLCRDSSFLNGTYYWWDDCGVIIAFDMDNEIFREILGPSVSNPESCFGYLMLYNDKIALMLYNGIYVDIWVMLEEGVWVKELTCNNSSKLLSFVGLWKNNEIFLATCHPDTSFPEGCSQLVLFNNNTREVRKMGPKSVYMCFRPSDYYESLVSVRCGFKQKGKHESLNTISNFLRSYSNPYLDL